MIRALRWVEILHLLRARLCFQADTTTSKRDADSTRQPEISSAMISEPGVQITPESTPSEKPAAAIRIPADRQGPNRRARSGLSGKQCNTIAGNCCIFCNSYLHVISRILVVLLISLHSFPSPTAPSISSMVAENPFTPGSSFFRSNASLRSTPAPQPSAVCRLVISRPMSQ